MQCRKYHLSNKNQITPNIFLVKFTNNKIVHPFKKTKSADLVAYMDATGGLIRSPNKESTTIYYYSIVIPIKSNLNDPSDPFSILNFVSASHTFQTT